MKHELFETAVDIYLIKQYIQCLEKKQKVITILKNSPGTIDKNIKCPKSGGHINSTVGLKLI